jgi:hypothetical protein
MRHIIRRSLPGFMIAMAAHAALALETIRPPGHRPLESSAHALVGARVVTKPGQEIEKANIIIRDGRIVAVGADAAVPADARVHDMSGTTIYAGFIDMHVSFAKSASSRTTQGNEGPPVDALDLTSGAGSGFLGVTSAAGEPGTKSVVTPERRMAREFAPEKKALDALRNEGFTAANIVPDAGVIRGVSAFVSLASSDPDLAIMRAESFQHIAIDSPRSSKENSERPEAYPGSLMGVIAVIRQTLLDHAPEGSETVAPRLTDPITNPRMTFLKLIACAGYEADFEPMSAPLPQHARQLRHRLGRGPAYPDGRQVVGPQPAGGGEALPADAGRALRGGDQGDAPSGRGRGAGGTDPREGLSARGVSVPVTR